MFWIFKAAEQQRKREEIKDKIKQIMADKEKVIYSKWIKKGTNVFIPTDNSQIQPKVDAGIYDLRIADGIGFYMFKREAHLDDLIEFPSGIHATVLAGIRDFWTRKAKFKQYGFAFKRGILLHGAPGSGKTCIINLAVKYMVEEMDGVVLPLRGEGDLGRYASCIPEIFRIIEKNRPIIVIFEDIENLCYGNCETELLNVLDGLDQLENVVYLATTNYIEKLKERVINRPSRFDRRIQINFLDRNDRIFYFEKKLKPADLKKYDIKKWADDTEGMSIAHLAELIKSIVIFDTPYDEIIATLRDMNDFKRLHSSGYEKKQGAPGFKLLAVEENGEIKTGNGVIHRGEDKY